MYAINKGQYSTIFSQYQNKTTLCFQIHFSKKIYPLFFSQKNRSTLHIYFYKLEQ